MGVAGLLVGYHQTDTVLNNSQQSVGACGINEYTMEWPLILKYRGTIIDHRLTLKHHVHQKNASQSYEHVNVPRENCA